MVPQIFVSYAREDYDAALKIYKHLESRGTRPFMDKLDLVGGEKWEQALIRAVRKSDFFLFCASKQSVNKRGAIQREIKEALDVWKEKLEDDIFFIPVRLEPCDVPENIKVFQWIDLFEPNGFRQLDRSIQEGLARLYGYEQVAGLTLSSRSISAAVEGCYDLEVHYPEFQPSLAPDVAAINATLASFAIRMQRRFEKQAAGTSIEERRQSLPEGFTTTDSLCLSHAAEYVGDEIVSVRFSHWIYSCGAAHPNSFTHTFNFRRHPFLELALADVLNEEIFPLKQISDYCIMALLKESKEQHGEQFGDEWIREGAGIAKGNFSRFLLSPSGLRLIFDPYEVSSYAEGTREVLVPIDIVADLLDPEILGLLQCKIEDRQHFS
jgi:hypothetical protein